MRAPLQSLSISGFRSIRELHEFPVNQLNVLVGANGAGKSNFVEFFRMLEENLPRASGRSSTSPPCAPRVRASPRG